MVKNSVDKSVRFSVVLPESLHVRLWQLSEMSGLSLAELVREALDRQYFGGGFEDKLSRAVHQLGLDK